MAVSNHYSIMDSKSAGTYCHLNENSPSIRQPNGLHIKLRPHQLTTVAAMLDIESKSSIVIDKPKYIHDLESKIVDHENATLIAETNFAILADKAGSGKSYMILSLILANKNPSTFNKLLIGTDNFSIRAMDHRVSNGINLIVVPHSLVKQWSGFLDNSDLKYLEFSKEVDFNVFCDVTIVKNIDNDGAIYLRKKSGIERKVFNEDKFKKITKECDVFLLNINRFRTFHELIPLNIWSRVIIDELDSIAIPGYFNEIGNFNWFITATPKNIFNYRCSRYSTRFFGDNRDLVKYFCVKNEDSYVDSSIQLPNPNIFFIETMLQRVVSLIQDILPLDIVKMINAGNMDEAIAKLNCNVSTSENIIFVLTDGIKKNIFNLELKLNYINSIMSTNPESHKNKIISIKNKIESNRTKLKTIEDRILSCKNEMCIICAGSYQKPTVVHCCKNIFCFECLIGSLASCQNKCPMCREKVTKEKYTVIEEGKKNIPKKKTPKIEFKNMNKSDVLEYVLKYIRKKYVNPKILIFSDYSQTFENIKEIITKADLTHSKVYGQGSYINNTIDKFNSGKINVLMLDSYIMGAA